MVLNSSGWETARRLRQRLSQAHPPPSPGWPYQFRRAPTQITTSWATFDSVVRPTTMVWSSSPLRGKREAWAKAGDRWNLGLRLSRTTPVQTVFQSTTGWRYPGTTRVSSPASRTPWRSNCDEHLGGGGITRHSMGRHSWYKWPNSYGWSHLFWHHNSTLLSWIN